MTTEELPNLFFLDRTTRGRLRVTGRDRQAFLQGMVTNDVVGLTPGQGCYAFLCDATAHVLSDVRILNLGDYLLLDVEPGMATFVKETLERYLIMEKCRIIDTTEDTRQFLVGGAGATDFLASLGVAEAGSWAEGQNAPTPAVAYGDSPPAVAARTALLTIKTFDIYLPGVKETEAVLETALSRSGATHVSWARIEAARIEAGVPVYGKDIDAKVLAPETGQADRAIHRRKGCYIGQEIVARIDARGHTNRSFIGFRVAGEQPPVAGTPVVADDREVGRVTSGCVSPVFGGIALGYLRNDVADAGTALTIGGADAWVSALPFGKV